jgi:TAG lipase/steryl ester hydrolase/phospholipase A2/LPA acyltransferase
MFDERKQVGEARRAMEHASRYADWLEAAHALDRLTGEDEWRRDDASPHYHATELRQELVRLNTMNASGSMEDLVDFLHESLHRHLNDLQHPSLYGRSRVGTKHLVSDYLEAIEGTIERLADSNAPGWTATKKLALLERALHNVGRSALLLSGGATLGFYHLGVVRAIWEQGLLPDVLSGASMGAMIAAGICGRSDAELDVLFAEEVLDLERCGLEWRSPLEAWREGSLMRPERMLETIHKNCGRLTFQQAYERSGRTLNISLAPTRARQKPRVLSHVTAPNVWIPQAALASSAVPGLFPPVTLTQRARDGSEIPYVPGERWIDGSFGSDLPMMRISRLHNVNHFIVSQTQPHALPLMHGIRRRGWVGTAAESAWDWARAQSLPLLRAGKKLAAPTPLQGPAELVHSLATQQYRGDIDIYPRFEPSQYPKLLKNPSREELVHFVAEGERAAWPRIAMIRDHTRLSRCLARCIRRLTAE